MSLPDPRFANGQGKKRFLESWDLIAKGILAIEKAKGFYRSDDQRTDLEYLMLMVTELAEAAEATREVCPTKSRKIPEFFELEEELADVVIRIMGFAELKGLKVAEAIIQKTIFNAGREFKHGKTC